MQTTRNIVPRRVWWLMPIILAFWEAEAGGWRSGDGDHPGHGETPSLLKIQQNYLGVVVQPVVPAAREAAVGELLERRRQRLR